MDKRLRIRKRRIIEYSETHSWIFTGFEPRSGKLSFTKNDMEMKVFLNSMYVVTILNHPRDGRTELFRKNVGMKLLEKLFKYPRKHTGLGFHKSKIKTKGNCHENNQARGRKF